MVLVAQRMGHRIDHLLPGRLAGGGELLAEVGGQDDDEDVTQELAMEGGEAVSLVLLPTSQCTMVSSRRVCLELP